MAARKRTQEEKNLKTLRELAALPANKQCFDCHQRGPTYINMTVGSFVCTSCSGILRGLNPPHRVKSITMTTFTPEEIEQIKNKGNEYCKYVWLGLYDSRCPMEPDSRDEQRTRDLMIQKYERKRWYVDPEIAMQRMNTERQQSRVVQSPVSNSVAPNSVVSNNVVANNIVAANNLVHSNSAVPDTKPLSSLLGKNSLPLVIHKSQPSTPSSATWPTPISSAAATTTGSQPLFKSNVDIFGAFGGDPFSSGSVGSTPTVPAKASPFSANGNFANFDSVFSANAEPQPCTPPVANSSSNHNHMPVTEGGGFVAAFPPISQPPAAAMSLAVASPVTGASGDPPQTKVPSADRYAALADLDNLFHQETPSQPQPQPQPQPQQQPLPQPTYGAATSAFGAPPASATSNPFAAPAPVWGMGQPQPQPSQNSAFGTPNPFEGMAPSTMGGVFGGLDNGTGGSMVPAAPMGGVFGTGAPPNGYAMAPPAVAQQKGVYPGWGVASPPGGVVSPPGGINAWGKVGSAMSHDWSQMAAPSPVNPFLGGQMPRTNSSNPFL
ncbi:unnamed protein product [Ixodes persulcatus]